MAQTVNYLPTMQETQVQSLGREDPLEKEMATHSIRAEYVGFGILILLMVVANLNDILRWLGYM